MQKEFKFSNPGTKTVPKYESVVERDGSVRLIPAGVRQLDLEIQADRDAGDINIIVRRYAAGDMSVLSRTQGWYGDICNLPTTRQELLQTVMSAEAKFDELPLELREKFDNDWRKAFAAMDTPQFEEIVKGYFEASDKASEAVETKE